MTEILPDSVENDQKVQYIELLPHEFRDRLATMPLAYLPLGTLEWHGEHLPLGSDAIISEGVMITLARLLGGIVLPPIHLGPDSTQPSEKYGQLQGMDYLDSSSPGKPLDGSCYWIPEPFFKELIERILEQVKRVGFKAVFADGHGPSRIAWEKFRKDWEKQFDLKLFGAGDVETAWKSQIDHAALNETSLVMAIRPDLPDLNQLSANRSIWPVAIMGDDPRDSSALLGQDLINQSVAALKMFIEENGLEI